MIKTGAIVLLTFIIGAGIGAAAYYRFGSMLYQADKWFEIVPAPAKDGVGKGKLPTAIRMSVDVAMDPEIGAPVIEDIKGQGKFVFLSSDERAHFGYVIYVKVKPTDLSKVPDKYKHDSISRVTGAKEPALRNAVFESNFVFSLLDKDGFELQNIRSRSTRLCAGENNRFQAEAEDWVDPGTIRKVALITYNLEVTSDLSVKVEPTTDGFVPISVPRVVNCIANETQ